MPTESLNSYINKQITQALTTLGLPVYRKKSPDAGTYPVIVYNLLSRSPNYHSGNKLMAVDSNIRVTLINNNSAFGDFEDKIIEAMENIDFSWLATNEAEYENEFYLVLDFTRGDELDV